MVDLNDPINADIIKRMSFVGDVMEGKYKEPSPPLNPIEIQAASTAMFVVLRVNVNNIIAKYGEEDFRYSMEYREWNETVEHVLEFILAAPTILISGLLLSAIITYRLPLKSELIERIQKSFYAHFSETGVTV